MKKIISALLLLLAVTPAFAVLKEQSLAKTLAVLRLELEQNLKDQKNMEVWYQRKNKEQHSQILEVMQRSNQIGLMLYSQKQDYTFDLAYACNEATSLYKDFSNQLKPFNSIVNTMNGEIERYTELISSLEKIPPMTSSARDSMFAGMSADSVKVVKERMRQMGREMRNDTAAMAKMKEYMLDSIGIADRAACLEYANALLDSYKRMLAEVQADNEHYEFVQTHLKDANDFAEKRYQKLQRELFVEGGDSYLGILKKLPFYLFKASHEIQEKYIEKGDKRLRSEWRGSVVFGLILFSLFYMLVAGFLASLITKGLSVYSKKKKDTTRFSFLRKFANTSKDKRVCTALTLAVILFAIALMVVISFMHQNFLVMASKLLIEYAWLLGVILLSLLVRLPGDYIKGGLVLYMPMLLMGFLIICLRIVFVPNDVLNLGFPLVVALFCLLQWWVNRKFRFKVGKKVKENVRLKLETWMRAENLAAVTASGKPKYFLDEESPELSFLDEKMRDKKLRESREAVAQKELELTRAEEKLTHSDVIYAWLSFMVMVVSLVVSFKGYTFMALQIFIWWLFQLTCVHTVTSLFDILSKMEEKHLSEKMRKAAHELDVKLNGIKAKKLNEIEVNVRDMKQRSYYISQTWLFDFLRICVVPVLASFSVFFSIILAADVFNLTEFCKTIFFYNFIDVQGLIQLSVFKITLAIALFFVFKFFNYLLKAIYLHFSIIRNLKDAESSATMFNNFASLLVWGVYFIMLLGLLQVPKSGISIVTAGLATGVGFAMKDLLENLFYGISLMTGRLKVGEWIECDGVRGKVEKIAYQSTTISTLDGCRIAFLNASLFAKNFKNLTTNHEYEFLPLNVGVAYGTDIDKARKVITDAINACNYKLDDGRLAIDTDKGVKVVVSKFGESSVDLFVSLWSDVAKKYWVKGRCLEAIYNALNANGIVIPFPQRDIHVIEKVN